MQAMKRRSKREREKSSQLSLQVLMNCFDWCIANVTVIFWQKEVQAFSDICMHMYWTHTRSRTQTHAHAYTRVHIMNSRARRTCISISVLFVCELRVWSVSTNTNNVVYFRVLSVAFEIVTALAMLTTKVATSCKQMHRTIARQTHPSVRSSLG